MANLPLKFFPVCGQARIKLCKVDKWAEYHNKSGVHPYFNTWEEAHKYMIDKAETSLARLERDIKSTNRHLSKVRLMVNLCQEGEK